MWCVFVIVKPRQGGGPAARGLRAMNMYTLISSVPLPTGQPVFLSRQKLWLFPPSECHPASYSLYSKDKHDRHEDTVQNAPE